MKAIDLTNEQIRDLTPEQIEAIDNAPEDADIAEFLTKPKKATTADEQPDQAEQDDAANGAGDEDEESTDGEETKPDDEEDEPIVLNKSGKGAIPYSAHKGLRVENATLKEQLEAKEAKIQEFQALLQEKKDVKGDDKAVDVADEAIAKHLETLKQDYPELHQVISAVLDGSKKQAEKLDQTLAQLKREKEEAAAREAKTVEEQVTEAKENNPDLVHWEVNDPEAWEEALAQDAALRSTAKWAKAPYAERFAEVVKRVRKIMPEASAPKTTKSTEQVKAEAKVKLEKAPVRKPTTLSDIPSGADPSSAKDEINNLSGQQLTARLLNMAEQRAAAMRAGLPD